MEMLDVRRTEGLLKLPPVGPSSLTTGTSTKAPWKVRGAIATRREHLAINIAKTYTREDVNKKPSNCNSSHISWAMVSLEDALSSLDSHPIPQISVQDFACILRKCRKKGNPSSILRLHAHIRTLGFEADTFLGNQLISMLVEAGHIRDAQQVFDGLEGWNPSSCHSLITGYVKCGQPHLALTLYERIQKDGLVHLSGHTFVALIKACTKLKHLELGSQIHTHVAVKGLLLSDRFLGSALIDMYAKCGLLAKAQELFNELSKRDAVSWNALIAGYAKHGRGEEALRCFGQMQFEGFTPTAVTFICSLKACGSIGDPDKSQELHEEVTRHGLEKDLLVGSALVDMHAKCGLLDKAEEVFHKLPVRNVVSWTALIKGYTEHGCAEEALSCFEQMQHEGVSPDAVAFLCALKACGKIGAIEKGQELHAEISRVGLEKDLMVGCALVDMYSKFGLLVKAQEVFDMLQVRDVMLWNTLMGGFVDHECGEDALQCYEQMRADGIRPNAVSFVFVLKACGSLNNIQKGGDIHTEISKKSLDKDLLVGSSLIDMYAKCGVLTRAQEVFDNLPARDVVAWTALIAGYAEHRRGEEALNYFKQMQHEGVSPNAITFACSLKACGTEGAIDKGQEIHAEIARSGLLEREPIVGNALIDMYAKCGLPVRAQVIFDTHPLQDIVSWNALIAGYAQLGESETVIYILNRMAGQGELPNTVTFVSVLNACSHGGLVDLGLMYFNIMRKNYGIIPTLEHHTCMVDLLGRAGQVEKALYMINEMQIDPDLVVWHTLLGACQKWGNVELGRQAFEQAVRLNGLDSAAYVSLSNIHYDDDDV